MNEMSFKQRILMTMGVPLLAFFVVAGFSWWQVFQELDKFKQGATDATAVVAVSKLVHEMQKERGISALYLNGGTNLGSVQTQQVKTREQQGAVEKLLMATSVSPIFATTCKNTVMAIDAMREKVARKAVSAGQMLATYSGSIRTLLRLAKGVQSGVLTVDLASGLATLRAFENAKEAGGKLRAKVTGAIASNQPITDQLMGEIVSLRETLTTNLTTEELIVDAKEKQSVASFFQGQAWNSASRSITVVLEKRASGDFGLDASSFMATATEALNQLGLIVAAKGQAIQTTLTAGYSSREQKQWWMLALISLVALITVSMMVHNLRHIMGFSRGLAGNLTQDTDIFSELTKLMGQSNRNLRTQVDVQASGLQQVAAAMEELSATAGNNTERATRARDMAADSTGKVRQGASSVNQLVTLIQTVGRNNDEMMSVIDKGNEDLRGVVKVIQSIGDKTKIINDIVFQTKLLSFNASVEAARAGEHGQGFAVVAEEVGNLAQMSGKAAGEISELIEASISNVSETSNRMQSRVAESAERSRRDVSGAVESAQQSAVIFSEIESQMTAVNEQVADIASVSEDQSKAIRDIDSTVDNLDKSAYETSVQATELSGFAESIEAQTAEMDKSTALMRAYYSVDTDDANGKLEALRWRDSFLVAVDFVDEQHQTLVEFINVLIESLNGSNTAAQQKAFSDMADFTVKHFTEEEAFMESFDYADIKRHKGIHKTLLEKVGNYGSDLRAGRLNRHQFVAFLKEWLIKHIMNVDTQYAKVANSSDRKEVRKKRKVA